MQHGDDRTSSIQPRTLEVEVPFGFGCFAVMVLCFWISSLGFLVGVNSQVSEFCGTLTRKRPLVRRNDQGSSTRKNRFVFGAGTRHVASTSGFVARTVLLPLELAKQVKSMLSGFLDQPGLKDGYSNIQNRQ